MYVKAQNVLGARKPKGLNRIANFRRDDFDLAIFHRWIRCFLVSSNFYQAIEPQEFRLTERYILHL